VFAVLLDLSFGERIEVGDDVRPGRSAIKCGDLVSNAFFNTRARKLQNT
jgi:hypothetical protein